LVSQQTSRIPELARHTLPPMIFGRTSRLSHPPILHRGTKSLTYGQGVPAPWNSSNPLPSSDGAIVPSTPAAAKPGTKDALLLLPNGKDKDTSGQAKAPPVALPDARLYATWDYEQKDYRVPIVAPSRSRTRMAAGTTTAGSMASPSTPTVVGGAGTGAGLPIIGLRSRSSSRLVS